MGNECSQGVAVVLCAELNGTVWREPLGRHNGGGWLELVVGWLVVVEEEVGVPFAT